MGLAAACGGNHSGAAVHTVVHVGPHTGAGGLFPVGAVAHGESMLEQVYPQRL